MFTWIPIYQEVARKVLEFESRQAELLSLLQKLRDEGLKVIQLNDHDASGKVFQLAEIDPLTFFSSFNRTSSIPGRQAILQRIKDAWNLSEPVPQDFEGIPIANALNSWAFAFAADRDPADVPILWRVAREAVEKDWRTFDRNLFNEALGICQMGLARMTMSLFWMKPHAYLSLDKNTRVYFEKRGIECGSKTAAEYYWVFSELSG
jgi:5-methylcytosine-specific restriction protein B